MFCVFGVLMVCWFGYGTFILPVPCLVRMVGEVAVQGTA